MKVINIIRFTLLSFFISCFAYGKDIRFLHIKHQKGLSSNIVYSITQDDKGFMWFGTAEGLNRYDGQEVKSYKHQPNDPNSISHDLITDLFKDSQNRLWIATLGGGVNLYNPQEDNFTHFKHDAKNENSLSSNFVYSIKEDRQGNIWVGGYDGLDLLETNNNQITRVIPYYYSNFIHSYSGMLVDELGRLWVASYSNGVYVVDVNSKKIIHHFTGENGLLSNEVTHVAMIDDQIWVTSFRHGIMVIDKSTFSIRYINKTNSSLPSDFLTFSEQDSFGNIWLGSEEKGLIKFDPVANVSEFYTYNKAILTSFSSHEAICFFEDASGTLWFGSYQGGVNFFHSNENSSFTQLNTSNSQLLNNSILPVIEDTQGQIWFGSDGGGLNRYNRLSGRLQTYTHNADDPNSVSSNIILSLVETQDGRIWVGTYRAGLNVYDPKSGLFKHLAVNDVFKQSNVWHLYEDSKLNLWVSSDDGIFLVDQKNLTIRGPWLAEQSIRAIYEDSNNTLWFGTFIGLYKMEHTDTDYQVVPVLNNQELKVDGLSTGGVLAIFEDSKKRFWLANFGGGLDLYDRKTGAITHYRESDGLSSNTVVGILEDKMGHLWVSTSGGLTRIHVDNNTFKVFNKNNGLSGEYFNVNGYEYSRDGMMYFGGIDGLTFFDPDLINYNTILPKVVLTDFKIFNESVKNYGQNSVLERHIPYAQNIELNHQQSVFSFQFAALNYIHPQLNQYAYMLEGFDTDWVNIGTKNEAVYTNLDAGQYLFKVKGSNNDGVWNENGTQIKITITPPWWETWWFRVLLISCFIFSAYAYYRFRVRMIEGQKLLLTQQVAARTEEIEQQKQSIEKALKNLTTTQEQLVHAEKMAGLGTLTAGVAHEINNPANFAHGGAQVLATELSMFAEFLFHLAGEDADPAIITRIKTHIEQLNNHIKTIEEGTSRIANIVKDLRTFTRTTHAEKEQTAIGGHINATVNLVRTQFANITDIKVELIDDPAIFCHTAELNQVFMNLIVNGCQAIAAKKAQQTDLFQGLLKIICTQEDQNLVIQFIDNGIGMTKTVVDRIYEPFFTTKSVGDGTGLGLSITFNIIEHHNGKLAVSSEPNSGSCFTLTLPINGECSWEH